MEKFPKKVYRVAFLGSDEVGKTSIIDQFMSSEHADVYEEIEEDFNLDANVADGRYEYLSTKKIYSLINLGF